MAVMQMDRICVCALKKDRKRLMEFLQRQGSVELSKVEPDGDFQSMDTRSSFALFEKGAAAAANALEILEKYCPAPSPMLGFLRGRSAWTVEESEAFARRWNERMADAERIRALEREIVQAKAEILKIEAAQEALAPWLPLNVPMTFQGTTRTSAWIGSVQGEFDEGRASEPDDAGRANARPVAIEIIRASREMTSFVVLSLRRDAKGVEEALSALGFTRPSSPSSRVPAEALARLEQKKREAQARVDASIDEIKRSEPLRAELRMLEDYLRMRAEKYAELERLGQSKHAVVLMGYVAREDAAALEKKLRERFNCAVEFFPADGDEDAPVRLKNRPYAAAVESVLESYSLPSRTEIDPSPVMSFFYYFMLA
jgi:V/A-type H+-transporting ATPase subunit I